MSCSQRITRFFGTLMFYPQEYLRWRYWPEEYAFWGEPLGLFHLVAFPGIDITYGICLWYIKRLERQGQLQRKTNMKKRE